MSNTRAKFVVEQITKKRGYEGAQIELVPVMGGSEENKSFWEYTPNGSINLTITNPKAIEVFQLGKEYYVDFTLADAEE